MERQIINDEDGGESVGNPNEKLGVFIMYVPIEVGK